MFPTEPHFQEAWLRAMHRESFVLSKHSVVCTKHFDESEIKRITKIKMVWHASFLLQDQSSSQMLFHIFFRHYQIVWLCLQSAAEKRLKNKTFKYAGQRKKKLITSLVSGALKFRSKDCVGCISMCAREVFFSYFYFGNKWL